MDNHGTLFTPGQQATITSRLTVAVPGALKILAARGLDIKAVLQHTAGGDDRLDLGLAKMFEMITDGYGASTKKQKPAVTALPPGAFIRKVKVDPSRTPEIVIKSTGCALEADFDWSVANTMPRSKGGRRTLVFFRPNYSAYDFYGMIMDHELQKECDRLGLELAMPDELAAYNEANQAFAGECQNATCWRDAGDRWCHMAFFCDDAGQRVVGVNRSGVSAWDRDWVFACHPKIG